MATATASDAKLTAAAGGPRKLARSEVLQLDALSAAQSCTQFASDNGRGVQKGKAAKRNVL